MDPIGVYGMGPLDEYKDIAKNVHIFLIKKEYELLKQYLINQYPSKKEVAIEKIEIVIELLIFLMDKCN